MSNLLKKSAIILMLIFFAACGRGGNETSPQEAADPAQLTETPSAHPALQAHPDAKLTILAPAHFARMINEAGRNMGITIELTTYNPDTHAEYWAEHLQNFDIFFNDPRQPLLELASSGILADFFGLIQDCPRYELADFYAQALHSLSTDGRLYFFPLGFGLQYVGINTVADIPPHIMARFMQKESITLRQMIEIYVELGLADAIAADPWAERDDIHRLRLANCRDMTFPGFMAWNGTNSFVNFDNMTADLTHPDFVGFLDGILQLYPIPDMVVPELSMAQHFRFNTQRALWETDSFRFFVSERYLDQVSAMSFVNNEVRFRDLGYAATPSTMFLGAFDYLFAIHNDFLSPINAILPFYHQDFDGFIPLADERGRLITNMATTFPWKTLSIVDNDNSALAWDFVSQYLLPTSLCIDTTYGAVPITPTLFANPNVGANSFDMPILRHLMPTHFTTMIELSQNIQWPAWLIAIAAIDEDGNHIYDEDLLAMGNGLPIIGLYGADHITQAETIQQGIARMEALHNMPLSPMPLVPFYLIEPTVLNMLRRGISPEEAAASLNEIVNAWISQY